MRSAWIRLVPVLLALACATQKQTTTAANCPEAPNVSQPSTAPLSAPAAATFNYLATIDAGSGLVVDLDQMERLGFTGPANFIRSLPRTIMTFLPLAGSVPDDDATGKSPDYTRYIVALAAMDEWADLPSFRRMGLWIPRTPQGLVGGLPSAVLIFATDKGSVPTKELFQGLAAISRVLSDQGHAPALISRGDALCAGDSSIGMPICLSADEGLLMLSMEGAPQRLAAAVKQAKPGAMSADVLSARFEIGPEGTVNVRGTGTDTLKLHAELVSDVPELLEESHARLTDLVAKYDANQKERDTRLQDALQTFNQKLSSDPNAPASLKSSAAKLTPASMRDPELDLAAFRQSLVIAKAERSVTADAQLSNRSVHALAKTLSPSNPAIMLGAMAAIAIPNFEKFQCRSKQSEARVNLKSLYVGQRSFFGDKDRVGKTFEEVGFEVEPGSRYNYCMAGGCMLCTNKSCKSVTGMGPCEGLVRGPGKKDAKKFVFQACAYGDVDGDNGFDVWTIAEDGQPVHTISDCGE